MRLPQVINRIGAAAAAFTTGVALLAAAVPANAAPADAADLEFRVAGESVVRTATKPFWLHLHNKGPAAASNIRVTIDIGDLDLDKVSVELPGDDGCETTGTKAVCRLGGLAPGENLPPFAVLIVTGVDVEAPGEVAAGSLSVEVTSDTPDSNPANNKKSTVPLSVSPLAVDMQVVLADVYSDLATKAPVKPGESALLNFGFQNFGSAPARGLFFVVSLPRYVTFADKFSYCRYNQANTVAACVSTDVIGAGLPVELKDQFRVTVDPKAPGPAALAGGLIAGASFGPAEEPVDPVTLDSPGDTGRTFKVSGSNSGNGRRAEADPTDNFGRFTVFTARNPVNLGITGGSASGPVGATVNITVKVRNTGPASAPQTVVKVTAPTGTELSAVPGGCVIEPNGASATCEGQLDAGDADQGDFSFKILNATVGTGGKAEIGSPIEDTDPSDNTAPITITVTAGGDGGLPITGVNATLIGGVGTVLAAAGVALFLANRRRRVVLVTPSEDS